MSDIDKMFGISPGSCKVENKQSSYSVESLYINTTVHDKILSVDWQMFSYQICLLLINSMVDSSIDSVIPVCVLRKKICFRIVPDNTLTINVRSKRS